MRQPSRLAAALTASLTTLALVLLVLNFTSSEKKIEHRLPHVTATGDAEFLRAMGNLLGPPLVEGNRVTVLRNGDEIFPSMLEAIRGARRTITFETYINWSGRIGRVLRSALRAGAGRRRGPRSARLGGRRKDGRRGSRTNAERGRAGREVSPAPLVHARATEQPDASSRRVSLEEWRQRPWTEKLLERGAGLLRSRL